MVARVALVLIAAVCTLPLCAQSAQASIEGQAINLKTGAPLRDATVTIDGPYAKAVLGPRDQPLANRVRVMSGDQGRFAFHNLAAGNYSTDSRAAATTLIATPSCCCPSARGSR